MKRGLQQGFIRPGRTLVSRAQRHGTVWPQQPNMTPGANERLIPTEIQQTTTTATTTQTRFMVAAAATWGWTLGSWYRRVPMRVGSVGSGVGSGVGGTGSRAGARGAGVGFGVGFGVGAGVGMVALVGFGRAEGRAVAARVAR